jgi:hypothetical protein
LFSRRFFGGAAFAASGEEKAGGEQSRNRGPAAVRSGDESITHV